MQGVILAGGTGSRLGLPYNKQAHEVAGSPMIAYPLQNMDEMGVRDVIIVSSDAGIDELKEVITRPVAYRWQEKPLGMANALRCAEGIKGVFPVLCGDVFFDPAPPHSDVPALITYEFDGAHNHTVWDPETNGLVEKPAKAVGQKAIVAYWFDEAVFELIKDVKPSERGELELIDIYRKYLEWGAPVLEYTGFFCDMGTPEGIKRVEEYLS